MFAVPSTTHKLRLTIFAIALLLATSIAHAAKEDWPQFWRERGDAPTRAVLDHALDTYSKQPYDSNKAVYEPAIAALQRLLAEASGGRQMTAQQRLQAGRASLFLGKMFYRLSKFDDARAAYRNALTLIESASRRDNLDAAEAMGLLAGLQWGAGTDHEALALYKRSLAIRTKLQGPNDLALVADLQGIADVYRRGDDDAEALPALRRALAIREKALPAGHRDIARSLEDVARLLLFLKRESEAMPLYQRSFAIRTAFDDPLELARDIDWVAHDFNTSPSSQLALYQKSLALRQGVLEANHKDVAWSLNRLGYAYRRLGRYADALDAYQRAAIAMEAALGPDAPDVAMTLSFVAEAYDAMDRYSETLPILQRVVAIREKHPKGTRDLAAALTDLARLYYYGLNRSDEAEQLFRRALDLRSGSEGYEFLEVESLRNLANLYSNAGRYSEALPLYERALAIDEDADVLGDMAMMYLALDDPEKALQLAQRSLAITEAINKEYLGTAASLRVLAYVYDAMGEPERALPLLQRSLEIWEHVVGPEHPNVAYSLRSVAKLHCSLKQYGRAMPLLHRAERIAIERNTPWSAWSTQRELSRCYRAQGKTDLSLLWGKQAVNTLQGLRAGMMSMDRDLQESFLRNKRSTYTDLAALLIREGRLPEAQRVMAMLKEEEYFDFVRRDANADPRSTEVPLTGAERAVHERYYAIRRELARLAAEHEALQLKRKFEGLTPQEAARNKVLEEDLAKARAAFDAFVGGLSRLLASNPEQAQSVRALQQQIQTHRTLLGTLGDAKQGVATLQYIATGQRLHIILTTTSVQLAREVVIESTVLNGRIAAFRQAVQNPYADPHALGRELYDLLIEPVRADLELQGVHTLMLFLDGALRYVPFAALVQEDDSYLIEHYRLAIHTEAARGAIAQRPLTHWRVAAMGVTRAFPEQNFSALPAVANELNGIVRPDVLPGDVYLDERFNRASFEMSLDNPVLHVASHFRFLPGSDASFLLLGDGTPLTLHDISVRDLRFDAVDLLTLSACETAIGGGYNENGLEVEGLGVLAQIKGAKAVLATLWSVADSSTGELMRHFYRLRQGDQLSKAEALRQAQLTLLNGDTHFSHPFYWAPFILMGNWL